MNYKIISFNNIVLENGLVAWNHSAFDYNTLVSWLEQNNDLELAVPTLLYNVYLKYKSIIDNLSELSQKSVTDIIDDILTTLPPKNEYEESYGYANHLAIFKIGVLINVVYNQGHDNPTQITEMLAQLVDYANDSQAECFQLSVNSACKFFIKRYSSYAKEIQSIIATQKHKKMLAQIDRGRIN